MHGTVAIGRGRYARKTYDLLDVGIVPSRPTRSSKEVDLSWALDAYHFEVPFVTHPTDAIASPELVVAMHRHGGLGVIDAEGILGRHEDYKAALAQVVDLALAEEPEWRVRDSAVIAALRKTYATPIDHALLAQRIQEIRSCGATVAVRVSPQRARELAPVVIKAGAEILFIQGTFISAEHTTSTGETENLKDLIGSLDVPVVAGGVVDDTTALQLMRAGVVGVIVGEGEGTSSYVLGISSGLSTAIADVAAARRDYLDESGGRYVQVIADGVDTSGDVVKAIAYGADAVMLGWALAGAVEAPGRGVYWQAAAAHPQVPRSSFPSLEESTKFHSLERIIHGPSLDPWGTENLSGGLRRAIATAGFKDIKGLQKVDLAVTQ